MPSGNKSQELELVKLFLDEIRKANEPVIEAVRGLEIKVGVVLERLESGDQRMQEHSDFIKNARSIVEARKHAMTQDSALVPIKHKGKKLPWYLVVILTGVLTVAGERVGGRVLTWLGSALQDPQVAQTRAQTKP